MLNMYNTLWFNYARLTIISQMSGEKPSTFIETVIDNCLQWRTSASTVYLTVIEAANINGDHYVMGDVTAPVIACWLADWSVFTPCPTITPI